jgi:hypothetical protein
MSFSDPTPRPTSPVKSGTADNEQPDKVNTSAPTPPESQGPRRRLRRARQLAKPGDSATLTGAQRLLLLDTCQPAFARRGLGFPLAGSSLRWRIFVNRSMTSEVSVFSPVMNASSVSRSVPARCAKSSKRILLALTARRKAPLWVGSFAASQRRSCLAARAGNSLAINARSLRNCFNCEAVSSVVDRLDWVGFMIHYFLFFFF